MMAYEVTKDPNFKPCKILLVKVGDATISKGYNIPKYVWCNYSYIAYMNRRSNGAMFPIVSVFKYMHFYETLDDIVRFYETYKHYTFMYSNISEAQWQHCETIYKDKDRDLENLRMSGFKFEDEPTKEQLKARSE